MNDEDRLNATSNPLIAPRAAPTASVAARASGTLRASPAISTAQNTAENEMIAPIERSTQPRIITRVVPIAAMPTGAAWRRMLPT